MTVHGVLNDEGKIEIKVPQLIARGSKDQGVFLRVGDLERVGTPEDEDLQMRFWNQFNDSDVKSICLDYDNGIHEFNYDGSFYFIQFNDARSLVKAQNPYYKPHVVGLFEPAAPTDLALYGKEEDYWGNFKRYRFDFVIPCQSVDGTYLSYDNMFFRIYFDDQVFTFTPEEYPQTFTDEISEVPFNHPASSEIPHPIWDSTMRQVYIYNLPSEKIGVQSCYKYNGQAKYSEISYIAADPSGVVNVNSDIIPSDVQYFDAWGRQTDGSNSGLVIVRKSYPDGRVITEKKINGCSSR